MQWLERFLLSISGLSLAGIVALFAISEPEKKPLVSTQKELATEITGARSDEMVVLGDEVDVLIERYFENIRQNPAKAEEHDRVVKIVELEEKDEKETIDQEKPFQIESHKVSQGDTLWRIAQTYKVPVYTILSANPHKKNSPIYPGEELRIPTQPGILYKVKANESLSQIAKRYKISQDQITDLEGRPIKKLKGLSEVFLHKAKPIKESVYIVKKRFILPVVQGRITSHYGWRYHPIYGTKNFHSGLDIAAPIGTPIRAAAEGVVAFAGEAGSYGFLVILRHRDDYFTVYAHCSKILVNEGDFVKQGQIIARVGNTGTATGAHLHFEVKKKSRLVNPILALKETIRIPKENG